MKRLRIIIITLCSLIICACNKKQDSGSNSETTDKLLIVTTTGMIADAVQNIAGDLAKVESLMGVGVDPHLYKATPSDLSSLRKADIIFYNGLHLEGNMSDVLHKLAKKKAVFALSDGIKKGALRPSADGSTIYDPHIWFDINIWSSAIQYVAERLIEKDPSNKEVYAQNTANYISKLKTLNEWTAEQIKSIPSESRVLITAHDAFGYFGNAYGIEVRGLQGISTVAEFGLKDISDLVTFIVDRKIKAVFVETSIPTKSLNAVVSGCKEKQHIISIGGTLYSDAMGASDSEAGNYIGMVKSNVNTIVSSLK